MSRKDDDYGFGLFHLLALGGLFAFIKHENKKTQRESELRAAEERHKATKAKNEASKRAAEERHKVTKARNEASKRAAEEHRRRNTECEFNDGISEEDFEQLALKIIKKIKRVKHAAVSGPFIYGEAESQSGLSTWEFCVDFNDYGHITGKYWIRSENDMSNIPNRIGALLSEQLLPLLHPISQTSEEDSYSTDAHIDLFSTGKNIQTPPQPPVEDFSYPDSNITEFAEDQKPTAPPQFSKKRKGRAFVVFFTLLFVSAVLVYSYWQYSKLILVGSSSSSFNNQNYSEAYEILSEAGFSDIYLDEVFDLSYDQRDYAGCIISVTIDGIASFAPSDKFPYDAEVIITYHGLKSVSAPIVSKDAKGLNYTDVLSDFKDAGFVNITLEPMYDIILGWFSKENEVDSISIDGNSEYDTGFKFRPDTEVVIKYHVSKKR